MEDRCSICLSRGRWKVHPGIQVSRFIFESFADGWDFSILFCFCQSSKENRLILFFVSDFLLSFAVCLSQFLICQAKADTETSGNITTSKPIICFKTLLFILACTLFRQKSNYI